MTAIWDKVRKLETGVWSRSRAIVILQGADVKGTIRVAYPADGAGRLTAVLHEHGFDPQIGTAGGYGYDKLSAALQGLTFNGITLQDHPDNWEKQLRDAGYTLFTAM